MSDADDELTELDETEVLNDQLQLIISINNNLVKTIEYVNKLNNEICKLVSGLNNINFVLEKQIETTNKSISND